MFHVNFEIDLPLVWLGLAAQKKSHPLLSHQQSLKMFVYI